MRWSSAHEERYLVSIDFWVIGPVWSTRVRVKTEHPVARGAEEKITINLDRCGLESASSLGIFPCIENPCLYKVANISPIDLIS